MTLAPPLLARSIKRAYQSRRHFCKRTLEALIAGSSISMMMIGSRVPRVRKPERRPSLVLGVNKTIISAAIVWPVRALVNILSPGLAGLCYASYPCSIIADRAIRGHLRNVTIWVQTRVLVFGPLKTEAN